MLKLITNAPIYVWPLLALLIWKGLKARKHRIMSWQAAAILPLSLGLWTLIGAASHYGLRFLFVSSAFLILGCWLGTLTMHRQTISSNHPTRRLEVPGSSWPLALSLSIFSLKYFLGIAYAILPEFVKSGGCLLIESITIILSGMLLGRFITLYKKSRSPLTKKII